MFCNTAPLLTHVYDSIYIFQNDYLVPENMFSFFLYNKETALHFHTIENPPERRTVCNRQKRNPSVLCSFKDFAFHINTHSTRALIQESILGSVKDESDLSTFSTKTEVVGDSLNRLKSSRIHSWIILLYSYSVNKYLCGSTIISPKAAARFKCKL